MSDETHEEGLRRVKSLITPAIMEFRKLHGTYGYFHAEDLRRYVIDRHPHIAPASADRILRQLRSEHTLHYQVVNRRQSLYQFLPPEEMEVRSVFGGPIR